MAVETIVNNPQEVRVLVGVGLFAVAIALPIALGVRTVRELIRWNREAVAAHRTELPDQPTMVSQKGPN